VNKKILKVLAAGALAMIGTVALVAYVKASKDRVVAAEPAVKVYVVEKDLAKGADAPTIRKAIALKSVPQSLRANDAIVDESAITDKLVSSVALHQGEQLLASRLIPKSETVIEPPAGLVSITIALDPQRAVGGQLTTGDTVGVFLSFDPFDTNVARQPPPGSSTTNTPAAASTATTVNAPPKTPSVTHLELHKILVTAVQYDRESTSPTADVKQLGSADATKSAVAAPTGKVLITLALAAPQAEQLVFASEFGHVWLANEPTDASESGTRVVTWDSAYSTWVVQ
jgi:pilus assembly protein CpaB